MMILTYFLLSKIALISRINFESQSYVYINSIISAIMFREILKFAEKMVLIRNAS